MKLIESKAVAWCAMVLVVAMVVLTMFLRVPWYAMIAEFFCFLAVFSHLASLYLCRMSAAAAVKLEKSALVCIIIAVIAFIVEYFLL